jgi:hypothetical protein
MSRLQGVMVGVALSMIAGISGGAQEQGALVAAVDATCSTPVAGVGSAVASAEQHVSHPQALQDPHQGRLSEYLSLHAEVRHQSGLTEGMPSPGPRARAN